MSNSLLKLERLKSFKRVILLISQSVSQSVACLASGLQSVLRCPDEELDLFPGQLRDRETVREGEGEVEKERMRGREVLLMVQHCGGIEQTTRGSLTSPDPSSDLCRPL